MAWTCLSCVYAHIGHVTKSIMVPIQWLPPRGCHPGVVLAGGIILWSAMVMMSCDLWHHCALHALTPSRVSELLVS